MAIFHKFVLLVQNDLFVLTAEASYWLQLNFTMHFWTEQGMQILFPIYHSQYEED